MKGESTAPLKREAFGQRLARFRKARGLTQEELGRLLGISQRMVAYYEVETRYVPADLIPSLTRILQVSSDELLGLKPLKLIPPEESPRFLHQLKQISRLPRNKRDQILRYAESLLQKERSKG